MDKEDLMVLLTRPVAFHPALARAAGGALPGLFLSQLLYWTGRGSHQDGWIWKDWKEWQEETSLTQDEQRGARRVLEKKGLVEVSDVRKLKIDKYKSTLCFRIDFTVLLKCISHLNHPQNRSIDGDGNFPLRNGNPPPRKAGNPAPEACKSHSGMGFTQVHSTESTSEISSDTTTTSGGSGEAPPLWLEAVEVEIDDQKKLKGVINEDGLRASILKRYARDKGPGQGVMKVLEARRRDEAKKYDQRRPEPQPASPSSAQRGIAASLTAIGRKGRKKEGGPSLPL